MNETLEKLLAELKNEANWQVYNKVAIFSLCVKKSEYRELVEKDKR